MKRFCLLMAVLLMMPAALFAKKSSGGWCHFGLTGGVGVERFGNFEDMKNSMTGWHLGTTAIFNLPAFFSIQPSVMYNQSNSKVMAYQEEGSPDLTKSTLRAHDISVPIAVQWGPDLGFCRIFLQAVPFADFTLDADYGGGNAKEFLQAAQFGFGAGAGINIWRFQIAARYNWSFGDWKKMTTEFNPFKDMTSARRGVTISFSYFFN